MHRRSGTNCYLKVKLAETPRFDLDIGHGPHAHKSQTRQTGWASVCVWKCKCTFRFSVATREIVFRSLMGKSPTQSIGAHSGITMNDSGNCIPPPHARIL